MSQDRGEDRTGETEGQVAIRLAGAETANRLALLECTLPAYCAGLEPHFHRQTTEAVYILHCMLACTRGNETLAASAGSLIVVQPGTVHRFWNPTGKPAAFLALLSPPGAEMAMAVLLDQAIQHTGTKPAHDRLTVQAAGSDHFPISTMPNPNRQSDGHDH